MAVLSLADAKTHLNITVPTYDAELQTFIDSAESVLAQHCGPLAATAKTERLRGGRAALALRTTPAISLTTVTPADGAALSIADLHLDQSSGVVTYNSGATFGARYYDVAYSAGRATCPGDLLLAVKELVRHLWESQRGGGTRRPGSAASEITANTVPGAAYLLPFRVAELIAPHLQAGFA